MTKTPKEKEKGTNGRQAPELPYQLATRVEGDEAEDGYRAERTNQRGTPSQNPQPKTPSTPMKPKFSRKTGLAKGVKNRSGSGSCTPPERDGGNSSIEQEPKRPGKPAPKALELGRIHRSKQLTERLPRTLHKWKPPFQPVGKQANTAKARPPSRDLGSREKKSEPFLNSMHSEE